MQEQKIPVTVVVNSDGVKEYEKELDKVAAKNEAAFNPKKELKEATLELIKIQDKFGEFSKEALAAAKRVAEVKDRINDARETADLFDPGKRFQVFSNALSSVAAGYGAVQGAIGLLGIESKEVEKQLLKIQSAMALAEGLSALPEMIKNFKALGSVIQSTTLFQKANNAVTAVAATVTKLFGGAVDTTAVSFKVLKGAIAATGIGLLVVALGEAVAALQSYMNAADEAAQKQKELNAAQLEVEDSTLKVVINTIQRQQEWNKAYLKSKKASDKELFEADQNTKKSLLKAQEEYLKNITGKDIDKERDAALEINKIKNDIAVAELEFQTQQEEKREQKRKESAERQKAKEKELAAERKQAQEAADKVLEDARVAKLTEREKALYDIEKNFQDQKKVLQKAGITDFTLIEEQKQLAIKKVTDDFAKQDQEVADKNAALKLEKEQKYTDQLLELQALQAKTPQEKRAAEIAAIEEDYARKIELAQKNGEDITALEAIKAEKIKAINQQALEDEQKILEAKKAAQMDFYKAAGSAIGALGSLFEQGTAASKTAALAELAINTGLGFVQGLDIAQKSAKATGPGAAFAFPIFYATQVAAVLAAASRAKAILATAKGGSGGASPSIPGGVSAAAAPSIPASQVPTQTVTQLDQGSINQLGNAMGRAYVVESDVTNQQERIRRISRAARLG